MLPMKGWLILIYLLKPFITDIYYERAFCWAEIQWSSWLEPFQYQLWFSIVGFINFILLVIWWIDWKSPYGHFRKLNGGDEGFTLLGN